MKFALITPTRGRPERFAAMKASAIALSGKRHRIEVHALIDPDDATRGQYPASTDYYCHLAPVRMAVPAAFEYCALLAMREQPDVLMLCSDDCLFRTPGWDDKIVAELEHYPDRLVCIAPDDLCGNGKANFWFVTREWVNAVGWFTWGGDVEGLGAFEHFCADTVVEMVAKEARRFVRAPHVVCEHMHVKYGKADNDTLYREKRVRGDDGRTPSDRDIERMATLASELKAAAQRVQHAINAARMATLEFDPSN